MINWVRLGSWWNSVRPASREEFRSDAVAGIPGAISSVPDGMASSVLVGVNPVYGLYASFAGPIAGGLTSSTRLMVVTTTSAASLAAGSALSGLSEAERPAALFVMTMVAGLAMVAAGLLRLGKYTRFVSHSVMIGFLTGVAVNIVLSQLGDLTGAPAEGDNSVAKAIDVITSPSAMNGWTIVAGALAASIVVLLGRGRWTPYAAIVALVVPTLLVNLVGADDVAVVSDVGNIPSGVPLPHLPQFGALSLDVVWGALAIAAIVLVQGAGVAEAAPNSDGTRSSTNRDFIAQGAGNVASSLFRGQPVGGSVGQTALNRSAKAIGRWAAIWSGIWMLVIVVALGGVVERVVMATLAAVLVVAAIGSIRTGQLKTIWRAGGSSQIALSATFIATLFLPIAAAVGIGVLISLMLQLNQDLMDLRLVRLVPLPDGRFDERAVPAALPDREVCIIDAYGSLLYAGARTVQVRLPDPSTADRPVVILRLRGRMSVGATVVVILADYAERVHRSGGRLMLTGVDPTVAALLVKVGGERLSDMIDVYTASSVVGESTIEALREGEAWLERNGAR